MLEILFADDEPTIRLSIGDALADAGYSVTLAADGQEALNHLDGRIFDLVISDIRMPKVDGLTLFRKVKELSPLTEVMLITAYGAVADAVQALQEGARDYLTKPFDTGELLLRVSRIAERTKMRQALATARASLARRPKVSRIIGGSQVMSKLLERIDTLAPSEASILIMGASGTGKELVARRLHRLSTRHAGPFMAVHCAAFPQSLIEAELFGHERGAFTGAVRRREGRFVAADGGTLFLDEVAEIPLPTQAKLLRVLQEHEVEPLGTNAPVSFDARIISATHRDLRKEVEEGRFREDLYYRLNVLDVRVPTVRERREDIPLLVEHFCRAFSPDPENPPPISPAAWMAINEYSFPGNVRELEHAIHHGCVLSRGQEILVQHLPRHIVGEEALEAPSSSGVEPLGVAARAFERAYLLRALREAKGRKMEAAKLLGISRKNLWEKLKGHKVEESEFIGVQSKG